MGAVLFDFDFTLADSSAGICECIRYAMHNEGLDIPEKQDMLSVIGLPLRDAFSILAPGHCTETLSNLFRERAHVVSVASTRVYEDVPAVMSALRNLGYQTGIVSTKTRQQIRAALVRDEMDHLFDIIIGGEDVSEYKPSPEGIKTAISRLSASKDSTFYVGDNLVDAKAAASAGVKFIAVSTGYTPPAELREHGALKILDELIDILEHIPREGNDRHD